MSKIVIDQLQVPISKAGVLLVDATDSIPVLPNGRDRQVWEIPILQLIQMVLLYSSQKVNYIMMTAAETCCYGRAAWPRQDQQRQLTYYRTGN